MQTIPVSERFLNFKSIMPHLEYKDHNFRDHSPKKCEKCLDREDLTVVDTLVISAKHPFSVFKSDPALLGHRNPDFRNQLPQKHALPTVLFSMDYYSSH